VSLGRAALIALALAAAPVASGADERQAARDTEFDGLKLLDAQPGAPGVQFGYVEKDTRPSEGIYTCGGMRRDEAGYAASTVAGALSNLPAGALARVSLRYVVLCGGATEAGKTIGGIPVAPLNLLMLDGSDAGSLAHRTLHELFHLAEYRSGGIGDADWAGQFGGGYNNRYPGLLTKVPIGSGKPGFVTSYGESHPHEDRAELFAYLLLAPREIADLISRRGDAVLRRKVDFMSDKCARVLGLSVGLPR
jgi:hypothetical protein